MKVLFWVLVLLGAVIGFARLVAIRWWQIPIDDPLLAASVTPTLHGGDWVLLWRATPPSFGAVVACPDPEETSRVVVGRMVGEERDKLTIDGERLVINDHEAHTESACSEAMFSVAEPSTGSEIEQHCDIEALGGVAHMRGTLQALGVVPQKTARIVGEGKVFLVSDNRAFPYDSRRYGSVDRTSCKESIFFRLVSKDGFFDVKSRLTYVR